MIKLQPLLLAGILMASAATLTVAQAASTGAPSAPTSPAGSSAVGGTAGRAAAAGTSASTLGRGATSTGPDGTASSLATGGSAAGGTRDTTSSKIHGNEDNLHGMSKARAQDGRDWSKSMTKTRDHNGEVTSTTRSMAHEPGGPPEKSTSTLDTGRPQQ